MDAASAERKIVAASSLADLAVSPRSPVDFAAPGSFRAETRENGAGSQLFRGPAADSEAETSFDESEPPTVVVPQAMPLTSTVTYSDIPGGYDPVALASDSVLDATNTEASEAAGASRELLRRERRQLENPDSVALLVVSPDRAGRYHAEVALTHRKLRFLFKDAIEWYLQEQGIRLNDGVLREFVRTNDANLYGGTPLRKTRMRVRAHGYDFDAPTPGSVSAPSPGSLIIPVFVSVMIGLVTVVVVNVLATLSEVGLNAGAVITCLRRGAWVTYRIIATVERCVLCAALKVAQLLSPARNIAAN